MTLFRVEGLGFRVKGLGNRVEGLGFRVEGSGLRIYGSGCLRLLQVDAKLALHISTQMPNSCCVEVPTHVLHICDSQGWGGQRERWSNSETTSLAFLSEIRSLTAATN